MLRAKVQADPGLVTLRTSSALLWVMLIAQLTREMCFEIDTTDFQSHVSVT